MKFDWDEAKNRSNKRKHDMDFEFASMAFLDVHQFSIHDRIEGGEPRWQTYGEVSGRVVVMVAHTWSEDESGEEIIRVISARRAKRPERKRYEENRRQTYS